MKKCRLVSSIGLTVFVMSVIAYPSGANANQGIAVKLDRTAVGIESIFNTINNEPLQVSMCSNGNTIVGNFVNTQLQLSSKKFAHQENPTIDIATVTLNALDVNSACMVVRNKTQLPRVQVIQRAGFLVLNLTYPADKAFTASKSFVVEL